MPAVAESCVYYRAPENHGEQLVCRGMTGSVYFITAFCEPLSDSL